MAGLGAPEIVLLIIAALLLFGYKRLPDASRSLGRSLRIFKGEMKGMKDDDVATRNPATTTPVRGQLPAPTASSVPGSGDLTAQLEEEALLAEARAAELRARVERARVERARADQADGAR